MQQVAINNTFALWSAECAFPSVDHVPELDRVTHVMVHRGEKGGYQFLLGAAIAAHGGHLFASWGNSRVDENDDGTVLAGRHSRDGGWTWSALEIISPLPRDGKASSHGVFLENAGRLWAFAPRAVFRSGGAIYPGLRTEAFVRDDASGRWEPRGAVMEKHFWPLVEPQKIPSGAFITAGAVVPEPERPDAWQALPAVAISQGADVSKPWDVIRIPVDAHVDATHLWAETAIIVEGVSITAVARYGAKALALAAESSDGGRTWSPMRETNLPMAISKPCAGRLSTGQRYLICNLPDGDNYNRDTLAIMASRPQEKCFSCAWRIRRGRSPEPRMPGGAKCPQWAYPYAIEHDGNLYVVYAVSKEDCALSIIPVQTLACS